jgi:hypothetical protein
MTDDEIRAFLEAGRDLQVASINADGTPHLVTMWYRMLDGEIVFWTYAKSQKVMNLRRDPRLTVLVATGDRYEQLKGVSIVGALRRSRLRALLGTARRQRARGRPGDGVEARRDSRQAGENRELGPQQAGQPVLIAPIISRSRWL